METTDAFDDGRALFAHTTIVVEGRGSMLACKIEAAAERRMVVDEAGEAGATRPPDADRAAVR